MSWFRKGFSTSTPQNKINYAACLDAVQTHWHQAFDIIQKQTVTSLDDVNSVAHCVEKIVMFLIEENPGNSTPILQYVVEEDVFGKVLSWSLTTGRYVNQLKIEQLKCLEMLLAQGKQDILENEPILRVLIKILRTCCDRSPVEVEKHLIVLLNQICVSFSRDATLLEYFFTDAAEEGKANFLVFSILIPFLHRDGHIGQQARDALLLCMSLSAKYDAIGRYIAHNSNFCPVLATGLSGLYSLLPRKLNTQWEDWVEISDWDISTIPELATFLDSLEFCNAVAQVSHVLVRDQLIDYVYHGFLVPVLAPALHQDCAEEVFTATAYLQLCLQHITEATLMKAFLHFLVSQKHDEQTLLDTVVSRILASNKLCIVSLSLIHTLLDINCEDIMVHLVFKYLVPCSHVMTSQRRAVKDIDVYCKNCEKFLSLIPSCCEKREDKRFCMDYLSYLRDARDSISMCCQACSAAWTSVAYDGETPSTDTVFPPANDVPFRRNSLSLLNNNSSDFASSQCSIRLKEELVASIRKEHSELETDELDTDSDSVTEREVWTDAAEQRRVGDGCSEEYQSITTRHCVDMSYMFYEWSKLDDEAFLTALKRVNTEGHDGIDNVDTVCRVIDDSYDNLQLLVELAKCQRHDQLQRAVKVRSWYSDLPGDLPDFSGDYNKEDARSLEETVDKQEATTSTSTETCKTPTKFTEPYIGPLLNALLIRLEGMSENSLHVNLQLTSVVSRLAHYPQPLLRSFLLSHNLVFQPSIRSLIQVLGSVKHKVEMIASTQEDFSAMISQARFNMLNRGESAENLETRNSVSEVVIPADKAEKNQMSKKKLADYLFRRASPSERKQSIHKSDARLVRISDGAGYRYFNRKSPDSPAGSTQVQRIQNAAYCAIILEEFLMELAAISQEHAVISYHDNINS